MPIGHPALDLYEVLPISVIERAGTVVVNEVVDVVMCDTASCGGDCEDESDGCQKIIAVTVAAGGSPTTTPDILYSLDGGATWFTHDIETLTGDEDASGVACVGSYVVVVGGDIAEGRVFPARVDGEEWNTSVPH